MDSLDDLVAPDYIDHIRQIRGLESLKQNYTRFYNGFPDTHSTIEDIIAEGDTVCVRFINTGTHTGEYQGLAPTGKKITFKGVQIWRIVDGKVVEKHSIIDILDACKQLGIIKFTERAKGVLPWDVT